MARLPIVFATAKANRPLDMWVVSYLGWDCRSQHHYGGGSLSGPPSLGCAATPCGDGSRSGCGRETTPRAGSPRASEGSPNPGLERRRRFLSPVSAPP